MNFRLIIALTLLFTSCRKYPIDDPTKTDKPAAGASGLFVLNEGLFQHNNASLQFFSDKGGVVDYFQEVAGRPLGDTGNDMKRYGNRLYVVMNVSSTLEIIDLKLGKSIKQVSLKSGSTPKQPRFLAFHEGHVFVSCYDGYVDVLDTVNYQIQQRIKVGTNPEQMVVSDEKLYVTNSGGLNFPNVDSTMSIIDLVSYEEKKVTVGPNPGSILSDVNGMIYIISRGNYNNIPSKLMRYNPITGEVELLRLGVTGMASFGEKMLLGYTENYTSHLAVYDPQSTASSLTDFISLSDYITFYRVQFSPENNRVYTFDARSYVNTGLVREYSTAGVLLKTYESQIIPTAIYYYVP